MHGLIFVTWEKYLQECFGNSFLHQYRQKLNQTIPLLANRVYDDALLLEGVETAHKLSNLPVDTLLQEFGSYFMTNGLTRYRCKYLLSQVHNGRDLLLTMHDAHEQISRLPDGLTPPLFRYYAHPHDSEALILIYDSPRKLCPVLKGSIEGTAIYFEEKVHISELTCMRKGHKTCTFQVKFFPPATRTKNPEMAQREQGQQEFARYILSILPYEHGYTLVELQQKLRSRGIDKQRRRPALLLQSLYHLHHVGLVASSANQPGDDFEHRRYWRIPTVKRSTRP